MSKIIAHEKYKFTNAPIVGGGYVSGFYYHPKTEGILYCKTDIGGSYRFDRPVWKSLIDSVSMDNLAQTYPISIALDEDNPDFIAVACGMFREPEGVLAISFDRGESFTEKTLPARVHGNMPGRGSGERLIFKSGSLWFASQLDGLWVTDDLGENWSKKKLPWEVTTALWISEDGLTVVCATAGCNSPYKPMDREYSRPEYGSSRGECLWVSYDGAETFSKMDMPGANGDFESAYKGLVPIRMVADEKYLYVTFSESGPELWWPELSYSCDTKNQHAGRVVRYPIIKKEGMGTVSFGEYQDITPNEELLLAIDNKTVFTGDTHQPKTQDFSSGFEGIDICLAEPGLVVTSTICRQFRGGDAIFISRDYGDTWQVSLYGMEVGGMYFDTAYMRPEYNGGENLVHWMSDIKINPHDANELFYTTGTGAFCTNHLLEKNPAYHDCSNGIEETVHLNVYAPCNGEIKLVDIVGDLGGFAYTDLAVMPDNSFANDNGDRYITCINADIEDTKSDVAVISARGNWQGLTLGGIIRTEDNFKTFNYLPMPYGLTTDLDELLAKIEKPNVNPGWVAQSSDTNTYVWNITRDIYLAANDTVTCIKIGDENVEECRQLLANRISRGVRQDLVEKKDVSKEDLIFSINENEAGRWLAVKTKIFDVEGRPIGDEIYEVNTPWRATMRQPKGLKVFSDRVDSDLFYGFGESGEFYISRDGGLSFYEKRSEGIAPKVLYTLIDTADKTQIRGVAGVSGVFYIATGVDGLYRLNYNKSLDELQVIQLISEPVYRVGIGVDGLYLCARIEGEYGFFRTDDEGETFTRLGDDSQMYGEINSMDADKRVPGRFFIGTGSVGVKVGVPI